MLHYGMLRHHFDSNGINRHVTPTGYHNSQYIEEAFSFSNFNIILQSDRQDHFIYHLSIKEVTLRRFSNQHSGDSSAIYKSSDDIERDIFIYNAHKTHFGGEYCVSTHSLGFEQIHITEDLDGNIIEYKNSNGNLYRKNWGVSFPFKKVEDIFLNVLLWRFSNTMMTGTF